MFIAVHDRLLILQFKKDPLLHETFDTLIYNALEFSIYTLLILTFVIEQLIIEAPVILASVIQQFVIKLFKILLFSIVQGSTQMFVKEPITHDRFIMLALTQLRL